MLTSNGSALRDRIGSEFLHGRDAVSLAPANGETTKN